MTLARAARLSPPRGRLMLTVQLAHALLLAESVELRGDYRGGALVGGPGELVMPTRRTYRRYRCVIVSGFHGSRPAGSGENANASSGTWTPRACASARRRRNRSWNGRRLRGTCPRPARVASQSTRARDGPGSLLANPLARSIRAAAPTAAHPGRTAPGRPSGAARPALVRTTMPVVSGYCLQHAFQVCASESGVV
jgi:hypothetical protein